LVIITEPDHTREIGNTVGRKSKWAKKLEEHPDQKEEKEHENEVLDSILPWSHNSVLWGMVSAKKIFDREVLTSYLNTICLFSIHQGDT
jgi:hypothetical protein